MDSVKNVIDLVNSVVWNWPTQLPFLVVTLLGTGIFLTIRLRFINIRGFTHAIRVVRGDYDDPDDPGDISHFQALTTALSATVGIGNIAGVATAIHYGGPGALFWMWLTALFGMTVKYTECTLALHYRRDNPDGSVSGGPMYYIENGLGPRFKPMALFFALCAVISSFGTGNAVQAFTMADQFRADLGIPTWISGAVAATVVGLVTLGGIRRIGAVASRVMPAMAVVYFTSAVVVLAMRANEIPGALGLVFRSAFQPSAAVAGFTGASFIFCLRWGVKRGLFSNEAGQGSAPIAHAAARTDEPVREGVVALLEPFIDTIVVCTLTGLMIVTTGAWNQKKESSYPVNAQSAITVVSERCDLLRDAEQGPGCRVQPGTRFAVEEGRVQGARFIINHGFVDRARILSKGQPLNGALTVNSQGRPRLTERNGTLIKDAKVRGETLLNGSPLTSWALQRGLSPIFPNGHFIITLCVFLFALSTAIGWSYYGDRGIQYLFNHFGTAAGQRAVMVYKLLFVAMHFMGAIFSLEVVWGFGDVCLGLMSFPNLIGLLLLSGTVAKLTREYFGREHIPFADRKS